MISVLFNLFMLFLGWRLTVNPPDFYLKLRYGNTEEDGRNDNYKKGMLGLKIFGTLIFFQFLYHLYLLLI